MNKKTPENKDIYDNTAKGQEARDANNAPKKGSRAYITNSEAEMAIDQMLCLQTLPGSDGETYFKIKEGTDIDDLIDRFSEKNLEKATKIINTIKDHAIIRIEKDPHCDSDEDMVAESEIMQAITECHENRKLKKEVFEAVMSNKVANAIREKKEHCPMLHYDTEGLSADSVEEYKKEARGIAPNERYEKLREKLVKIFWEKNIWDLYVYKHEQEKITEDEKNFVASAFAFIVLTKWARLHFPGVKVHESIVFDGETGCGKTELARCFSVERNHGETDQTIVSDTKKLDEEMRNTSTNEIADIVSQSKKRNGAMLSEQTRPFIKIRRAYGKKAIKTWKRFIFIGTKNPGNFFGKNLALLRRMISIKSAATGFYGSKEDEENGIRYIDHPEIGKIVKKASNICHAYMEIQKKHYIDNGIKNRAAMQKEAKQFTEPFEMLQKMSILVEDYVEHEVLVSIWQDTFPAENGVVYGHSNAMKRIFAGACKNELGTPMRTDNHSEVHEVIKQAGWREGRVYINKVLTRILVSGLPEGVQVGTKTLKEYKATLVKPTKGKGGIQLVPESDM